MYWKSPVTSTISVQERYLLKCYDILFVITCSLSSEICAKEYPEKYHPKEAGDKLWQWILRCYATPCSVYSCRAELHQQSSKDFSVTLHRPRMGAGEGKVGVVPPWCFSAAFLVPLLVSMTDSYPKESW